MGKKANSTTKSGSHFSAGCIPSRSRSYTTVLGIDGGKFLILATDARTTEVNGRVDEGDFVKHIKINHMVYLVYAGDNKLIKGFAASLVGMVPRMDTQDVDSVAEVAAKLLEKICIEDHLLKEERKSEEERLPANKRTKENVECELNIILAGKSRNPSGLAVYYIDVDKGIYTPKKVNITFAGSGMQHAWDYAKDLGYVVNEEQDLGYVVNEDVDRTDKTKALTEDKAKDLAMHAIEDATHKDWRSGGRIHILILRKKGAPSSIVYNQEHPNICTCPYFRVENEIVEVKCPTPTHYPNTWRLEHLDEQLIKLRERLTTDFEVRKTLGNVS